jgi:hypothetical protein
VEVRVSTGRTELQACSACGGDYEDPERTAWTDRDIEDEDDHAEQIAPVNEFPVQAD